MGWTTGRVARGTVLLMLAVLAVAAPATAATKHSFRPRIGKAMGIVPAKGQTDIALAQQIPVVYHGGTVMPNVTVHTIFWAPQGYAFSGSPGPGVLGYEALIQQFFTDAAHDSGQKTNLFSILNQYGSGAGPGSYNMSYDATADTVNDGDPFPARPNQCASPEGITTCVTDLEIDKEIDHVIATHDPSGYGLHDLWLIFLPPNVDECISVGSCGTNSFAGYHALGNTGHGEFIYSVIIDTSIEALTGPGGDPEGNPEAESVIDTAAHETVEAVTDPEGIGWMDPNGFEVADKCETPQTGTPLGFAPDGSPYNQLVNGHQYEIQSMWSNVTLGCEQTSTATTDGLPLPTVSMRQFSPFVSGSSGQAKGGVAVHVGILRGFDIVALAVTTTRSNGSWGPVELRAHNGRPHAPGDDRDAILVEYAHGPSPELIATGSGGNPFTESGWTGWLALDTGFQVTSNAITVGPCGQTGVLRLTVNGTATSPPVSQCSTEADQATVKTSRITPSTVVTLSSSDNRAVSALDPRGALINLTVPVGEPDSISAVGNDNVFFEPSGQPECSANLRLQNVTCAGLVPFARYTLTRTRGRDVRSNRADLFGTVEFAKFRGRIGVTGGDVLTLGNSAHHSLTTLHVAHLRVAIKGNETVVDSGTCQPGDYWGEPLTSLPSSPAIGFGGATGLGNVCPADGRAGGMPTNVIAQVDDLSGGATRTSVPLLLGTAPANDAIITGAFTALAQTGVNGANGAVFPAGATVALSVIRGSGRHVVFRTADVGRHGHVPALPPGVYTAKWVLSDINGDTRTVVTKFVEQ